MEDGPLGPESVWKGWRHTGPEAQTALAPLGAGTGSRRDGAFGQRSSPECASTDGSSHHRHAERRAFATSWGPSHEFPDELVPRPLGCTARLWATGTVFAWSFRQTGSPGAVALTGRLNTAHVAPGADGRHVCRVLCFAKRVVAQVPPRPAEDTDVTMCRHRGTAVLQGACCPVDGPGSSLSCQRQGEVPQGSLGMEAGSSLQSQTGPCLSPAKDALVEMGRKCHPHSSSSKAVRTPRPQGSSLAQPVRLNCAQSGDRCPTEGDLACFPARPHESALWSALLTRTGWPVHVEAAGMCNAPVRARAYTQVIHTGDLLSLQGTCSSTPMDAHSRRRHRALRMLCVFLYVLTFSFEGSTAWPLFRMSE